MKSIATGLTLAVAAILTSSPVARAWSHQARAGWAYDRICCGGHDCREIADDAVEAIRHFNGLGWRIKATGEVFADAEVRWSKDGHWHRCSVQGRDDTATACLYRPPPGS